MNKHDRLCKDIIKYLKDWDEQFCEVNNIVTDDGTFEGDAAELLKRALRELNK